MDEDKQTCKKHTNIIPSEEGEDIVLGILYPLPERKEVGEQRKAAESESKPKLGSVEVGCFGRRRSRNWSK